MTISMLSPPPLCLVLYITIHLSFIATVCPPLLGLFTIPYFSSEHKIV